MWKYGLILILAAALLAGCKGLSQEIAYTPPALAEEWTVNMTQSGGIMGMLRTIEVKSDGNFTVIDQRVQKTATGKLTEQELTELAELVKNMEFAPPKIPATCADCFVFDVEIQSGGRKMVVKADDTSLPNSGMESLVDFLREIMDSALK
ncbi:MAG: hypothetical protein HYZ22_00835 [Chloroflexi bacterium]|nr:hypothetical protein [Chloroflexota bacterium]